MSALSRKETKTFSDIQHVREWFREVQEYSRARGGHKIE